MTKFYKRNADENLNLKLFQAPTEEYRGAPFWAWNGRLDRKELLEQIGIMREMGMGGFHIHVRTGLDTPYLGEEYMEHVRACVEKAKKEHMLTWLYDEDRWPSGSAGGRVTDGHPEYAAKILLLTVRPYEKECAFGKESVPGMGRGGVRQENGKLLAVYDVCLKEDGTLQSYRKISSEDKALGVKWYAYLEHASADPWFNDAAYVDTLNPEAVARFLKLTHQIYEKELGDEFGKRIPAVFTDEPQFNAKSTLDFAGEEKDVFLPWTQGFEESYREKYHADIMETLPELLWELGSGEVSLARYRYHDFVADRFARSYCGQIGKWCRSHGIRLTGHVLGEGSLEEQTMALGECMRCYGAFDIPGMDSLCDRREYTTAKQVQSAVHQQGAEAMLSELYGVTGWDYDFRGYKLQGDWQAALGVTVRVPHLFWMTMKGEAKRDFPPSIGYQSPWYGQFSMLETYFARLNTALTRGKPSVKIGVIHPIESYWLHWGPAQQTAAVRSLLEENFQRLTRELLFSLLDFDFISESCLPDLCPEASAPFKVGCMTYEAIIVCGCETLRSTTLERLEAFSRAGGDLIFAGECPAYIDAVKSHAAEPLYERSRKTSLNTVALRQTLEKYAFVEIRRQDGSYEDSLLSQVREDGKGLWLFLANGKKPECADVDQGRMLRIGLKGMYDVVKYDAMTGGVCPVEVRREHGKTLWEQIWYIHDSLLVYLTPAREVGNPAVCRQEEPREKIRTALPEGMVSVQREDKGRVCFDPVWIKLEEPNMCLLDMAEYAVDGGEWQSREEILRIDNIARAECGLPLRRREVVQPYLLEPERPEHSMELRFAIESRLSIPKVWLGLEDAASTKIRWNGREIFSDPDGFYVDKAIEKVLLPGLLAGENLLEITVPLGRRTNLEPMYLLGDFGVEIWGTRKLLVPRRNKIGFGDITPQGFPFYTGNLEYSFLVETDGSEADGTGRERCPDGRECGCAGAEAEISVPRYRGGLIKVFVDGREAGNIVFSPYKLSLGRLSPGRHWITLRLYGTRQNGFGQLHHTPGVWFYQGPNSWRSSGELWCYEYQLKEFGILSTPRLKGLRFVPEEEGAGIAQVKCTEER